MLLDYATLAPPRRCHAITPCCFSPLLAAATERRFLLLPAVSPCLRALIFHFIIDAAFFMLLSLMRAADADTAAAASPLATPFRFDAYAFMLRVCFFLSLRFFTYAAITSCFIAAFRLIIFALMIADADDAFAMVQRHEAAAAAIPLRRRLFSSLCRRR